MRSDRKFTVILGSILAAIAFFPHCGRPVLHKCPQPLWMEYSSFQSDQIKKETVRLEALLAGGDTIAVDSTVKPVSPHPAAAKKLSGLEIRRRLFELSIHHAAADYDLDKISAYAFLLRSSGGPDSLRYLNWDRAAHEQKTLVRKRDSLTAAIAGIFENEKKESKSLEKLKKEIRGYQKQLDSLHAVINLQRESIAKLQKIDLLMEQQRRKIH